MVGIVTDYRRELWRALRAWPAYEALRNSRLRELRGLVYDIQDAAKAISRQPSFRGWLELCMLTRRYAILLQDRWVTLAGAWIQETNREFIATMDFALSLRGAVLDSIESDAHRKAAERYYRSMEGRRTLSQHLDGGEPEAVYGLLWRELESETMPVALEHVSELARGGEDAEFGGVQAVFLAASRWALAHKLLNIAVELDHEAGPFTHAIAEHYAFAKSAVEVYELLLDLAAGAGEAQPAPDELLLVLDSGKHLAIELKQTIYGPLERFCAKRSQLLSSAGSAVDDELEHEAAALVESLKADVRSLIDRADADWKRLVARLPEPAWRAWCTLGAEDGGVKPPTITSEAELGSAGAELVRVLSMLPDLTDFPALEGWLALVEQHGFRRETGVSADEAALRLVQRMVTVNFAAAKPALRRLIIGSGSHFSRGNFPLSIAGTLVAFFKEGSGVTDDDRSWINELLDAVLASDAAKFGRRQSKEALVASLLSIAFFAARNDQPSAERLGARLDRCLAKEISSETRVYFLQFLADNLSRLISPARSNEHFFKLIALRRHLQRDGVRWPDGEVFETIDRVIEEVQTLRGVA